MTTRGRVLSERRISSGGWGVMPKFTPMSFPKFTPMLFFKSDSTIGMHNSFTYSPDVYSFPGIVYISDHQKPFGGFCCTYNKFNSV